MKKQSMNLRNFYLNSFELKTSKKREQLQDLILKKTVSNNSFSTKFIKLLKKIF